MNFYYEVDNPDGLIINEIDCELLRRLLIEFSDICCMEIPIRFIGYHQDYIDNSFIIRTTKRNGDLINHIDFVCSQQNNFFIRHYTKIILSYNDYGKEITLNDYTDYESFRDIPLEVLNLFYE